MVFGRVKTEFWGVIFHRKNVSHKTAQGVHLHTLVDHV